MTLLRVLRRGLKGCKTVRIGFHSPRKKSNLSKTKLGNREDLGLVNVVEAPLAVSLTVWSFDKTSYIRRT